MPQSELLPIAESLAGLIPRLARGLSSHEKDLVDELPLAQLRVCGLLSEGPGAMSALSRELGVSLSALTQIADRLERAGIVKRIAAGDDRRVRCLQLTSRGETMMRKRRDARLRRSVAVLECMTSSQREQVQTAMETLLAACARLQQSGNADACNAAINGNGGNGHNGNGHARTRSARVATSKKSKTRTDS